MQCIHWIQSWQGSSLRGMSKPRRREPVAETVYRHVRDAIVDGAYPADSQLVQEQVADELGVSRTPVREALNRLAAEGLVTWVPRSGYTVNGLADADITDVFGDPSPATREICFPTDDWQAHTTFLEYATDGGSYRWLISDLSIPAEG